MALLAELETLNGLPAHPLIVHLPVMMIPLALVGAFVALVRPSWRSWATPVTATFALLGAVGVQLAIMSGEGLEELAGEEGAAIERHAQLAEQARPLVVVFLLVVAAAAVAVYLSQRDPEGTQPRTALARKAVAPLLVLSVLTGGLATAWVYRTGHTGAESVWEKTGDEGGDSGDRTDVSNDRDSDGDQPAATTDGDADGD